MEPRSAELRESILSSRNKAKVWTPVPVIHRANSEVPISEILLAARCFAFAVSADLDGKHLPRFRKETSSIEG